MWNLPNVSKMNFFRAPPNCTVTEVAGTVTHGCLCNANAFSPETRIGSYSLSQNEHVIATSDSESIVDCNSTGHVTCDYVLISSGREREREREIILWLCPEH